jgi:hypothetical protein
VHTEPGRASAAPKTPTRRARRRLRRNARCHCGSGQKYKNCCLTLDEARRRSALPEALPDWLRHGPGKLRQFERYATKVYNLPGLLADFTDSRRRPRIPTFDVVNSLLHTALLRVPSLNALEGNLEQPDFQKLLGHRPRPDEKPFSAEVVANVLDQLDLADARRALEEVVATAERNKAFRDSYAGLRCVAIDGWEPVSSFHRHCDHCLVRTVKTKLPSGELGEREQYYHAYVVALLLGPVVDVVLGIEPLRNAPARRQAGEPEQDGAEGELTAALRLLDFLHATYGSLLDLFVLDGLYPNGPVMTRLDQYGYSALIVLKKPDHEPLKEALALWHDQPPSRSLDDEQAREHIDFWDLDGIETLDTYPGKVRVLRAEVTQHDGTPKRTWCFAALGKKAARLSAPTALRIQRARWHLENTAFHQWITRWNLGHVFRHTGNALLALLLLWALTFNLLQLFVYRRLGRERRPKDPTDTIRHLVELMLREVATLPAPIPWDALLDSS